MNISVIIPIYKVSAYIAYCAESLFRQTMEEGIEFIFVDDCTPDDSIAILNQILDKYPNRKGQVVILHHEQNRGLPAARNTGLKEAGGEYVFHCDSDDWLEPEALQKMYDKAIQTDADFVWCDWYLTFSKSRRYMNQPSYDTAQATLLATLGGALKYNVWNKLVRRSLYFDNDIRFPEGHAMGEDMTMIRLLACARQVAYVPCALYNYVKHEGEAFTNGWSERNIADVLFNTELTAKFLSEHPFASWQKSVAWLEQGVKYPFLISNDRRLYSLWQRSFVESNHHIWDNPYASLRRKLLSQAAAWGCLWLVRLHYVLLYKVIYGVIYK